MLINQILPDIEEIRGDFPYLSKAVYLDNASVSPISLSVEAAMRQHTNFVVTDPGNAHILAQPFYDRGREMAAALVGGKADRVSYIQNTSHGLSLVALGLDWNFGDNILIAEKEFPSNLYCWLQLKNIGVEVRLVQPRDGRISVDDFQSRIDARTRLISVSHVQYYSGYRVDLAALGSICADKSILLVVDGTQSVGALDINVGRDGIDVLCVSAHKWLAGPRGIGFACFSERAFNQLQPKIVGWRSAENPFAFKASLELAPDGRRFESGCENGSGIMGLASRLSELYRLGPPVIEKRVLALARHVRERCAEAGLSIQYDFKSYEVSGITIIRTPSVNPEDLKNMLRSQNVHVSVRGGAVRISANYYNIEEELNEAITLISDFSSPKSGKP